MAKEASVGNSCVILKCAKCGDIPHTQDELHGEGMRVHNRKANSQLSCTRCGNLRGEAKVIDDTKRKSK
jgi:hypothetical protein